MAIKDLLNGNELGKYLYFDPSSTNVTVSGSTKTIVETDGEKTRTTTIEDFDTEEPTITEVWS